MRSTSPVEVEIRQSGGSSEMAREVREGRLDLAFVALPGDGPSGLELIPLAREPIMLAVPAEHPLASRADIELAALRDETLVDLAAGWGIRIAVDRSFAAAGVTRTITSEVNDTATMIDFIRNGLAIGLLPRSLEVNTRTDADPRLVELTARVDGADSDERASLRVALAAMRASVRSEKLGEVAGEFDRVHTVQRALQVGSIDAIIPAARLRPHLIEAVERGMRRTLERPLHEVDRS